MNRIPRQALRDFFAKALRSHRKGADNSAVTELTAAAYQAGECGPKDANFCFLVPRGLPAGWLLERIARTQVLVPVIGLHIS